MGNISAIYQKNQLNQLTTMRLALVSVCSKVWLVLRGFTLTAVTLHTVQCSCMPHLSLTNILYFTVLGINSLAFVPVQLRDASICISPITASTADLNIEQTGSVGNRGLDEIRLIVKTRPLAPWAAGLKSIPKRTGELKSMGLTLQRSLACQCKTQLIFLAPLHWVIEGVVQHLDKGACPLSGPK